MKSIEFLTTIYACMYLSIAVTRVLCIFRSPKVSTCLKKTKNSSEIFVLYINYILSGTLPDRDVSIYN